MLYKIYYNVMQIVIMPFSRFQFQRNVTLTTSPITF